MNQISCSGRKRIAVLCANDVNSSPRPNRLVKFLHPIYDVTVYSPETTRIGNVESVSINLKSGWHISFLKNLASIFSDEFQLFSETSSKIELSQASCKRVDLCIVESVELLPFAFSYFGKSKIIFDCREYFFDHLKATKYTLRYARKKRIEQILQKYLTQCDSVITVSNGLKERYDAEFQLNCVVIKSFADFKDLKIKKTFAKNIKIIHHGNASPSRNLESFLELAEHLDEKFTLDLMLVPTNRKYYETLKLRVQNMRNVNLIEPVPYEKIIDTLCEYDIGLSIFFSPRSFNLSHSLPNKFYEYVQSRLMIITGENCIDMANEVAKYNIGIAANDSDASLAAKQLNTLTVTDIDSFKRKSEQVASALSTRTTAKQYEALIKNLLAD